MPLKPEINNNPSTFPGKIAAEKKKKSGMPGMKKHSAGYKYKWQ